MLVFCRVISFLLFGLFLITSCHSSKNKTVSASAQTSQCVDRVMAIDDSLGTVRNHACESISLSQTIKDYVNEMGKINYRHCPKEFSSAFKQHREAWKDMIVITDHYPDLRGEMHDLFDIIKEGNHKEEFELRLKRIWDTWEVVEKAKE